MSIRKLTARLRGKISNWLQLLGPRRRWAGLHRSFRSLRFRTRIKVERTWQRKLRPPMRIIGRWWILWSSILIAGGLYITGFLLVEPSKIKDYHLNLIVEAVGVAVALPIVWLIIDRQPRSKPGVSENHYIRG